MMPYKNIYTHVISAKRQEELIAKVINYEGVIMQGQALQMREDWRGGMSSQGLQMQGAVRLNDPSVKLL